MTDKQGLEIFQCMAKYFFDLKKMELEQKDGATTGLDVRPYIEPTIDRWLEEAREEGRRENR